MAQGIDSLEAELSRFRERVDRSDPAQVALLKQMEEHSRRLAQVRGQWDAPSWDRSWNDPRPPEKAPPPSAIESYK